MPFWEDIQLHCIQDEYDIQDFGETLEEAIKEVSNIRWPAVLPSRLQRLRGHFQRLGQLNDVLKNSVAFPSPEPIVRNTLIVPSLGTDGESRAIRVGVTLRLEFTSIKVDEENVIGSQDFLFVYASFDATVKDLAKVWIKIWVGDQVSDTIVDAWFDKARFEDIPPLFLQRFDVNRWNPLPWDFPLRWASRYSSGQVVALEHESSGTSIVHPWQEVWIQLQQEMNLVAKSERLRNAISAEREVLDLKDVRLERLATSLPHLSPMDDEFASGRLRQIKKKVDGP
ncbi:MAG: hypothetical protein Q9160_004664 [Pyrenula sp. 1 TL-2023]